jgi:hypothetical protein
VIYPLAYPDSRLSSWVSGIIWNTGFQQTSRADSPAFNYFKKSKLIAFKKAIKNLFFWLKQTFYSVDESLSVSTH